MSTAERMRLFRERRKAGVVAVVQVPIYIRDVSALAESGRLEPEHARDRDRIAEAVEDLVDDFTEGKLCRARP